MVFVHGDNLTQKETHDTKYTDSESKRLLAEIRKRYNMWKKANMELVGPLSIKTKGDEDILKLRVNLLNEYKEFIDQQKYAEKFDSRSNLHSSVLEEFMYYLFKDLVAGFSKDALVGKAHVVKDLFFLSPNYKDMLIHPSQRIEEKDHDFVIGVNMRADFVCSGQTNKKSELLQIPAVAVECKTYLDKTMLEGSSAAAEQLKLRNPNSLYIVVSEWLKLTEAVNLNKYKVDQIYVLRKQKNTDREFRYLPSYSKNPISDDCVVHLFNSIRDHLTKDWEGSIEFGLQRGWLK